MTRCVSTFDYLVEVNLKSGRSSASISNYPIFPCVIASFEKDTFDESPRNLAQQGSKAAAVAELNAHLMPFTVMTSDVETRIKSIKEDLKDRVHLTPEWFSCPEVLTDVELPAWATSPSRFIELHRYALEKCPTIEKWIDTSFGNTDFFQNHHPSRFPESRISSNWLFLPDNDGRPLNCFLDWDSKWTHILASILTDNESVDEYLHWSKDLKQCLKVWTEFAPWALLKVLLHFDKHDDFAALTINISLVVVIQITERKKRLVTKKYIASPKSTVVNSKEMICCTVCSQNVELWAISTGATIATLDHPCTTAAFDIEGGTVFLAAGSLLKQFTNSGSFIRQIDLNERITCLSIFRSGFTFVDLAICAGDQKGNVSLVMISFEGTLYIKKKQKTHTAEICGFSRETTDAVVVYSITSIF